MIWAQMVLPKKIQSYVAAVRQSKEQVTGNMVGWGVIWYVLAGALVILGRHVCLVGINQDK